MDVQPLCQILYSEEYKATMETLRHHLEEKIYTEEALGLTEKALELLASHYTTWQYRFAIVKHLGRSWFDELDWCELVALDNEKNYQIWNYRQLVIEEILALADAARFDHRREHPILTMMLQQDLKNHHVWTYRKWYVERFGLHDDAEEVAFLQALIDMDLRNNSAWTHRYFLKFSGAAADVEGEIDFVKKRIALCPQNPSTWNYLQGIYRTRTLVELEDFCLQFGDVEGEVKSTFAVELLAKIALEKGDKARGVELYGLLAQKYDPIRANYWQYLARRA